MNRKSPFAECRAGRVTAKMFVCFLKGYVIYWYDTYAKSRIPLADLQEAEKHVIQYAKEHGMKLVFKEMNFRLSVKY
jgi:hypothetical protein